MPDDRNLPQEEDGWDADLPVGVYAAMLAAPPLWPSYMRNADDEPDSARPELAGAGASSVGRAFAFLGDIGFRQLDLSEWPGAEDDQVVVWARRSALVAVVVFGAAVSMRIAVLEKGRAVNDPMDGLLGDNTVDIGGFPLAAEDEVAIPAAMSELARMIEARVGPLLAEEPISLDRLGPEVDSWLGDLVRERRLAWSQERMEAALAEGRDRAFLDHLCVVRELGGTVPDPSVVAAAEARVDAVLASPETPITVEALKTAAATVRDARSALDAAFELRGHSSARLGAWEDAAFAFRQSLERSSPDWLWRAIQRTQTGEPGYLEALTIYLEADPWSFRSGYAKQYILRAMRRASIPPEFEPRLRAVLLRVVDVGDRREFREHFNLARRIVNDELRAGLRLRLHGADPGVARRAAWMLDSLQEQLSDDDRRGMQRVIEHATGDRQWYRVETWVATLAIKVADPDWLARLEGLANAGDPTGRRLGFVIGRDPEPEY